MQSQAVPWLFWLFWLLAFLGFPPGGLIANLVVGPVTTPVKAALAGLITGAVIGLAEWLALRGQLNISPVWIAATAVAMSLGLAISTALLGDETAGNVLLYRALITGACIGIAQMLLLPQGLPKTVVWAVVVTLGWALGWFVTRGIGVDMAPKWSVFGAAGAITYQVVTGAALYFLLR